MPEALKLTPELVAEIRRGCRAAIATQHPYLPSDMVEIALETILGLISQGHLAVVRDSNGSLAFPTPDVVG